MSQNGRQSGGCHCGAVRYEAATDFVKASMCNCSICHKKGLHFSFVPTARFTLLSGEDSLADYQFAKKTIHHQFCRTCGVESFAKGTAPDGTEIVAINVRCLDDVDLNALELAPFDGKSL